MAFFRMLISSALAFLCTAFSATAEGHWSDVADRLDGVQGWEELCAIEDCEQFPEGYVTFALGPELYYLPLPQTLQEPITPAYSIPRGRYIEADGEIIGRSFDYDRNRLRLTYCCSHLLRFFDLDQDFPKVVRETHGPVIAGALVDLFAAASDVSRGFRIERSMGLDVTLRDPALGYSEVFPNELQSFNDDFWLLHFSSATDERPHNNYSILSKRPIFNNRLLYGSCGRVTCMFYTADFREDSGNKKPLLRIRSLWIDGVDQFDCVASEANLTCTEAPESFGRIEEAFERLEIMFNALKVFPENGEDN
jgi:hypothetical protein